MEYLPGIFALIVAAAGWFYMFYSRAANRLAAVEDQKINRKRVLLRRVGGFAMVVLGACFYAGYYATDPKQPTRAFATLWFVVLMLMMLIMVLGLIDLRLTRRLREEQKRREGR
jgi:UDP-N-acetylmuramyl pentapeptide phosphotransferase/UDP-N-acetylglucosamine-1-phosphate transferase